MLNRLLDTPERLHHRYIPGETTVYIRRLRPSRHLYRDISIVEIERLERHYRSSDLEGIVEYSMSCMLGPEHAALD